MFTFTTAKIKQPHVLFVSIPWRGHVNPLRSIGKDLLSRGFVISFALCEEYRDWVQSDGFEFIPSGTCAIIQREPETYLPVLYQIAVS